MIGLIGRKVLFYGGRGRDSRGAAVVLVAALVAIVVGYIGLFFGRMIRPASAVRANRWPTPARCSSPGRPPASPAR